MTYASLCFLSFNRPAFIRQAVQTARGTAEFPHEIIVHDDGSNDDTVSTLLSMRSEGLISKLILGPPGHNEGVGAAFNRAVSVSTGDPICKLDQDLVFHQGQGWLRRTVEWLNADSAVGMFGLFKYPVDPVDWKKMNHRAPYEVNYEGQYEYVDDFVGSAMLIPREIFDEFGPFPEHSSAFAEDVEYKKMLQSKGFELALPCNDLATNIGFGIGPSTVVVAPSTVQAIHDGPLVFQ